MLGSPLSLWFYGESYNEVESALETVTVSTEDIVGLFFLL